MSVFTSGVPRNRYYSADGDDTPQVTKENGINKYLLTLIDPFKGGIAKIPDANMTASLIKTTKVVGTIVSGGTNQGLLVVPFHSADRAVRFYAWDSGSSTYNWLKNITQDEDLSQDFRRIRLISGGLSVSSSTVASGSFSLSGTMVAVAYQDLPPVRTLTHQAIVGYKRDNTNVVGSVGVDEGVTMIAAPDDEHHFRLPETNSSLSLNEVAFLQTVGGVGIPGWDLTDIADGTARVVMDGISTNVVPANLYGHNDLRLVQQFVVSAFAGAGTVQVQLKVSYAYADPTTYALTAGSSSTYETFQVTANGAYSVSMARHVYLDQDITNIQMIVTRQSGNFAITPAAGGRYEGQYQSIYAVGRQGPGCIVGWTGVSSAAQITLEGVMNYEVVPGYALSRNVGTSFSRYEDSADMQVAETILSNGIIQGLKFVYTRREYRKLQQAQFFENIAGRERALYKAASVNSVLRNLWDRVGKPVLREGVPMVARVVGSALNSEIPGSGAFVEGFGNSITRRYLSADAKTSQYHCASKSFLASPRLPGLVREMKVTVVPPSPGTESTNYRASSMDLASMAKALAAKNNNNSGSRATQETNPFTSNNNNNPFRQAAPPPLVNPFFPQQAPSNPFPAPTKDWASGFDEEEEDEGEMELSPEQESELGLVGYSKARSKGRFKILEGTSFKGNGDPILAARVNAFTSGNSKFLDDAFNSIDMVYGKAQFVIVSAVETDPTLIVNLCVCDKPYIYENCAKRDTPFGAKVIFEYAGGGKDMKVTMHIDSALGEFDDKLHEMLVEWVGESPIWSIIPRRHEGNEVSLWISTDIPRPIKAVGGTSYEGALISALWLLPNKIVISGSLTQGTAEIAAKVKHVVSMTNTKLALLNADVNEVEALRAAWLPKKMLLRRAYISESGQYVSDIMRPYPADIKTVAINIPTIDELINVMAMQIPKQVITTSLEAREKYIDNARKIQLKSAEEQAKPTLNAMIGGESRYLDVNKIDWNKFIEEADRYLEVIFQDEATMAEKHERLVNKVKFARSSNANQSLLKFYAQVMNYIMSRTKGIKGKTKKKSTGTSLGDYLDLEF